MYRAYVARLYHVHFPGVVPWTTTFRAYGAIRGEISSTGVAVQPKSQNDLLPNRQITFFRNEITVKFDIGWGCFFRAFPSQENSGLTGRHFEIYSLFGPAC